MKVKEILNKSLSERLPAARRISRFPSARKILWLSSHRSVFRFSHLSFHAAQNDEWRSPPRHHPARSERKMCTCLRQNSCPPLEGSLAFPLPARFFDSVLTVPFSAFLTCHSIPPLRMTNGAVPRAVILSGRKGKCVPVLARTLVASLEGSLASPLPARFFDSVLTVPFSAFLTCHSMPPRITNGAVHHAVILSGRKGKCVPVFTRTVVASLEGSPASPLPARFFGSVLTVPFSAFLTCHSIPPLRMTLTISYISHAFDKSTHSGFKR